jgi:hypothetical protein
VAAYVRRQGDRAVLIIVNLGDQPLTRVSLSSPAAALPPGRHELTDLLAESKAASLRVEADGRIRVYTPFVELPALQGYILEVSN